MFKNLFNAAWKSESAIKRLSFIEDVDASTLENQTVLETLALNDIDDAVRQAAIAKISNPQFLYDLWQSEDTKDVGDDAKDKEKEVAESRLKNIIQSGEIVKEADLKPFLAKHPKANLIIALYCPYEEIRNQVLANLQESEKANIIADVAYSASRVMLAENIHTLDALEIARKLLKGRDKTAEKIIKTKIDEIHASQKQQLENNALALSLREKMEGLTRYINWTDEIRVKFFEISKAWDSLTLDPPDNEAALYAAAFTSVSEDVKHHMAISLSQQNQEKIVLSLEALCDHIAPFSLDSLLLESESLNKQLDDLSEQLNKESATIPYADDIYQRFVKAKQSIESAIAITQAVKVLRQPQKVNENDTLDLQDNEKSAPTDQVSNIVEANARKLLQSIKRSTWSKTYPLLHGASEAKNAADSILSNSKKEQKEAKERLDKLHQKINRTFAVAKRGDIGRAQRDLASLTRAVSKYDGFDRIKLDERIDELTAEVNKMGDWKDFAIEPKLIELCEQMEVLPELERLSKNPSADRLAKKIKHLQDAWKALGSSEASDTHWPRFKQAGDTAYEPCAEFFKKRREIQAENLNKRETLIAHMKDLLVSTDWDNKPDFKAVEESISHIMQDWKKIKDVEHGKGQRQWEKLSRIKDQINEKLDVEYDKNIAAKYVLTAQFEQMLEEEVTEKTLDKLKFLQSKWKQVGVTRRKQDQTAWLKFKAASDAVYEKIQGIRQEKRAVEDEQITAYKHIHTQIRSLARTTQDLAVSDKEFDLLKEKYTALPALPAGLPEKLIERLDLDFIKACDTYAGAKDRLNQAKVNDELEILATKAQLCSELEQLAVSTDQTIVDALLAKLDKLEINNKDYQKRFAKRLKKAREADRDEFTQVRRRLLIDCEILLDKDSPKEDKDLRLHIQLERMKEQGLGNTLTNASELMEEYKLEWLFLPGADAKLQKQFDERFNRLIQ